jgi:hypothetical protein
MDAGEHGTAVLTALALVEARLARRDADFTYLLDHADTREAASMLADFCALLASVVTDDPPALIARLRPVLMAAEPPARPPGRAVGD